MDSASVKGDGGMNERIVILGASNVGKSIGLSRLFRQVSAENSRNVELMMNEVISEHEIVKRSREDQPYLITQPGQAPFKHRVEEHIRRKAFEKALENSRKALEREERQRQALRK